MERGLSVKLSRPFLYITGWISLILGVIGAFLPVLPTTPFIILSSLCFSKSSKRMHNWLTSIPLFGNAIMDWEKNKVIRPKAKRMALIMIWLTMGASIIFGKMGLALKVMLFFIGLSVSTFILTRKSKP